jgi:hypothetical protein
MEGLVAEGVRRKSVRHTLDPKKYRLNEHYTGPPTPNRQHYSDIAGSGDGADDFDMRS